MLCMLAETLNDMELAALTTYLHMVINDAAVVRRDSPALVAKINQIAQTIESRMQAGHVYTQEDAAETVAFLRWVSGTGFETFAYVYYAVQDGARDLVRDAGSALGVLCDPVHPVYGNCLARIPGDLDTLCARKHTLSIVKADVQATLHRDQQLDFIGIRDTNEQGVVAGEHCLVGLFSRAATSRPLADFPFARGRIAQVFRLAGVRPEGFRAEKFLDILESLPRSEVLEAQPEWLAAVSGAVVALYKRPRAKVFARRDVYGRHLNVLVYMPRELYSATLSDTLADTLHQAVDASGVLVQTLLSDGPLARLYLIAREARPDLDLEHDIQQPLLAVLEGWHTTFDDLADANSDAAVRTGLRKLCLDLPAEYIALTTPLTAYHDLCSVLAHTDTTRVQVRVDQSVPVSIRLLSVNTVPSLSKILPAMHNAGVVIEREQTYDVACHTDGARVFITCLSPDAASAEKLLQAGVADAARELFESLFNNEAEDGRLNALVTESGMRLKHVQVIRAYASYWRQAGCRFSLRYIAECL